MRVLRSVLGGCVCVVACVVVLTTITSTPPAGPAIHSIVSHNLKGGRIEETGQMVEIETQQGLNDNNHNSNGRGQDYQNYEELEGKMTCDEEHLEKLGFIEDPELYPKHLWDNLTTPVLASAVSSEQVWQVDGLLGLAQQILPNLTVVVYSLDLSTLELQQLEDTCNTSCVVMTFDFNAYPSHIRDLRLKAYRPIIIQELLMRTGAVLWLDASVRLADETQDSDKTLDWSEMALKSGGVLTWPLPNPALLPSAALTHPNMFTFFHTKKHNYDFQQMGDAGTMMVYNTAAVHQYLMKPWVSCALTHNCISPIGAQDTGCRYDKKPLFRYSGCHHYDASAFNVALGVMFSYDTRLYLAALSPFIRVSRKPQQEVDNMPGEEGTNTSIRESSSRRYSGKRTVKIVSLDSSQSGSSFRLNHQNTVPNFGSKVLIQDDVIMTNKNGENGSRETAGTATLLQSTHSVSSVSDEGKH